MPSTPKALNVKQEKQYYYLVEKALSTFKRQALKKYNKGRLKYQNDPKSIDYQKEIDQELMDLIIYYLMQRIFSK